MNYYFTQANHEFGQLRATANKLAASISTTISDEDELGADEVQILESFLAKLDKIELIFKE